MLIIIPRAIAAATVVINGIIGLLLLIPLTIILFELTKQDRQHSTIRTLVKAMKSAVLNPLVIATIVGIFFSITQIPFPPWVASSLTYLSNATFATALFAVGMSIEFKALSAHSHDIFTMVFLKMVCSPILAFFIAELLHLRPVFAIALVVIMSLATAKSAFVISEEYGVYVKQSAEIVTITTLACIIVIPFVIFIANIFWPGVIHLV